MLKRKMEPMALFFELIKSKVKPRPRHVAIVFTEKKTTTEPCNELRHICAAKCWS